MIRNLIFDMGGVVLPMRSIEEPIRRFSQIGLGMEEARHIFGLHGQKGIFFDIESGALGADEFLRAYYELTGFRATFADIEWAWRGFVSEPPQERLEWLLQLRREGFNVVMLSNTNPFLMHYCESTEFTPEGHPMSFYFHRIFRSYLLGACKPDPHIFQRMMEQGGYKADECLFLDDALNNVLAARNLGMYALHVPDNEPWLAPLRRMLKV